MIIMIMAAALIQCMILTHAGWMTFAGVAIAGPSAAARLDTSVLRGSNSLRADYTPERRAPLRPHTLSDRSAKAIAVTKKRAGCSPARFRRIPLGEKAEVRSLTRPASARCRPRG